MRKEKCHITRPEITVVPNSSVPEDNGLSVASTRKLTLLGSPVTLPNFIRTTSSPGPTSNPKLTDNLTVLEDSQLHLNTHWTCHGLPKFCFSTMENRRHPELSSCLELHLMLPTGRRPPKSQSDMLDTRHARLPAYPFLETDRNPLSPYSYIDDQSEPRGRLAPKQDQKQRSWNKRAFQKQLLEIPSDAARLYSISLPHSVDDPIVILSRIRDTFHPCQLFVMCATNTLKIPCPASCGEAKFLASMRQDVQGFTGGLGRTARSSTRSKTGSQYPGCHPFEST